MADSKEKKPLSRDETLGLPENLFIGRRPDNRMLQRLKNEACFGPYFSPNIEKEEENVVIYGLFNIDAKESVLRSDFISIVQSNCSGALVGNEDYHKMVNWLKNSVEKYGAVIREGRETRRVEGKPIKWARIPKELPGHQGVSETEVFLAVLLTSS